MVSAYYPYAFEASAIAAYRLDNDRRVLQLQHELELTAHLIRQLECTYIIYPDLEHPYSYCHVNLEPGHKCFEVWMDRCYFKLVSDHAEATLGLLLWQNATQEYSRLLANILPTHIQLVIPVLPY